MGSIPTSDRVSFLCSVNLSQDPFCFYTSVLIDNFLFAFFFLLNMKRVFNIICLFALRTKYQRSHYFHKATAASSHHGRCH